MHAPVTDQEIEQALRGAPTWITHSLMRETIRVWQPRQTERLTADEALEMLLRVGQLYEILFGSNLHARAQELEHRAQSRSNTEFLNALVSNMEATRDRRPKKRR